MKRISGGSGARLGMPVSAWPADDQEAWTKAFERQGRLSLHARAVRMAPRTRLQAETSYARWLVWLGQEHPESLGCPAAARASRAWVLDYMHLLAETLALRTVRNYGRGLRSVLQILAPREDWRWFSPIIDTVEAFLQREPRKARPYVEIGRLFTHGIFLMDTAGTNPDQSAVKVAEQYRDGLAFALLAERPLRRQNMIELTLGDQFVETRDGYRVILPPEVYKTRIAFEFPLPDRLVPYVRHYLAEHRRVLAAGGAVPGCQHLWLARSGAPWPSDTFADMISRETTRRFGIRLTPHDFRHCAATSIILISPEDWPLVRVILGHATDRTAEQHYMHPKRINAAKQYHEAVYDRRRRAKQAEG